MLCMYVRVNTCQHIYVYTNVSDWMYMCVYVCLVIKCIVYFLPGLFFILLTGSYFVPRPIPVYLMPRAL